MTDAARPSSQLLSKMRSSFATSATIDPTTSYASTQMVSQPAQPEPAPQPPEPTEEDKLAAFDNVLAELEQEQPAIPELQPEPAQELAPEPQPLEQPPEPPQDVIPAVIPQVIEQATDTLNPGQTPVAAGFKEAPQFTAAAPQELPGGMQAVEYENSAELSPEVAEYIQRVEDHQEQLPQEIVIADGNTQLNPPQYLAQPVVVLPITAQQESEGKSKGVQASIRWLVELSRKFMKMFSGKVIYRQEPAK